MNIEFIWKAALVVGVAVLGAVSYMFMGGKHDNPVEEHSEKIIYHYTGLDVDLTPQSAEGSIQFSPLEDDMPEVLYDMVSTQTDYTYITVPEEIDKVKDEDGNE